MSYKNFKNNIKKELEKMFPMEEIMIQKVMKNKSEELDGFQVINSKGVAISPVICLNNYYQDYQLGSKENDIVQDIYKTITGTEAADINCQLIMASSQVNNHICYRLINSERNKKLLKTVPHIPFHDLSIVFFIMKKDGVRESETELIKNDMAVYWKMDAKALYKLADENTAKLLSHNFQDMSNMLIGLAVGKEINKASLLDMRAEAGPFDTSLYVLTNGKNVFGAACILYPNILERIAGFLGNRDYYILPSSVHEVIILPASLGEVNDLRDMVREVNQKNVAPEELLSDNVYFFSYEKKELTMC